MVFPRLVIGVLAAALVASSTACTGAASTLHARKSSTVKSGQFVDASTTAAVPGKHVSLMLPSGRADLTLTTPTATVPAERVERAAPLMAARGTVLVGVGWQLQRAAYPDSPNRQLTEPVAIFGEPQAVRLWLVTDGTRREIPHVGTLGEPVGRPSNAVWLGVPAGGRAWSFQIEYDGLIQTVDARTAEVTPSLAAPLYRDLPLDASGTCQLGGGEDVLTSCLTKYAVGYPYVGGAGWAPAGRTWVLLQIVLDSSNFQGAELVTVAGVRPRAEIGKNPDSFSPFLVPSGAASLSVRGTVPADDLHKGPVRVALTTTLATKAAS
jgi:hypothetical protein